MILQDILTKVKQYPSCGGCITCPICNNETCEPGEYEQRIVTYTPFVEHAKVTPDHCWICGWRESNGTEAYPDDSEFIEKCWELQVAPCKELELDHFQSVEWIDIKAFVKTSKTKDLKELQSDIVDEIKSRHADYLLCLAEKAKATKDERLIWNAEAMLHDQLGVKPSITNLGEKLASIGTFLRDVDRGTKVELDSSSIELLVDILRYYDFTHYVQQTTRYDGYDNGFFFRGPQP